MTAVFCAFQFLTVIPPIIKRSFTERELGLSVGYYPLVGLVVGGVLLGSSVGFSFLFPDMIRAALLIILWITATGGLHLDGFLDSLDGLLGGSTPGKRLEIMHDERVGAFGFAGGAALLLLKFSLLASLSASSPALLLVPVLSRWGMSAALVLFPYGRESGVGRVIKDNAGWLQGLAAAVIALLAAWFAAGWLGMILFGSSLVLVVGLARFTLTRLPGMTGDIYGAINEILEVLLMMVFFLGGGQ